MVTTTSKLALNKPDTTDLVDIAVLNQNADKIDAASGATICTSTTRPASPWNGQVIFETDSFNALVYRSSTSTWTTIGGSTVASAPPASAGNGNLWWDSDNGKLYIYYADGNSSQWVAVIPGSGANQAATNHIINSDFSINQRSFTSSTTNDIFGFDRWQMKTAGGTTYSAQTFTPGSGPVAGVEAANYARLVTTGQSGTNVVTLLCNKIEDVRLLASKTVTVSFYAKAASGTPKVALELEQAFGSGGSPSTTVLNYAGQVTLSTSWARYSVTVTLPSLTGKTIGTTANTSFTQLNLWTSAGTDYNARTGSMGIQSNTFDFWGVQVEENPQASAYKPNQNTKEAELAACQRYYYRVNTTEPYGTIGFGSANASNQATISVKNPVTMRAIPTASESANIGIWDGVTIVGITTIVLRSGHSSLENSVFLVTVPANPLPQYRGYFLLGSNSTSGYLGVSAEL